MSHNQQASRKSNKASSSQSGAASGNNPKNPHDSKPGGHGVSASKSNPSLSQTSRNFGQLLLLKPNSTPASPSQNQSGKDDGLDRSNQPQQPQSGTASQKGTPQSSAGSASNPQQSNSDARDAAQRSDSSRASSCQRSRSGTLKQKEAKGKDSSKGASSRSK